MHGKLATITSTKESELQRSDSSESIANTVPGLREDSIRPNRHGKVTRRATASVCLQCALRRLEQRETASLTCDLSKRDATGTYPWWASPAEPVAASVAVSPLVSLPMLLERSAFTRAT